MAGATLLSLLDDITAILDDIAVMTKVAAKKTAGVVGDDLALNAKQVVGLDPVREIPVVLKVAKGSLINKAILVPAAIAIAIFIPWAITPLLMLGGLYLCYEGVEKILHGKKHEDSSALPKVEEMHLLEKEKIRGAVRTDFILSAEIIAIALGTVADAPLGSKIAVLTTIALGMTIGVYGLVAGIVKLDDLGLHLVARNGFRKKIGVGLLKAAPLLMRFLTIAGTAAMFLVGGEILAHGIPAVHDWIEHVSENIPGLSWLLATAFGVISGGIAVLIMKPVSWSIAKLRKP